MIGRLGTLYMTGRIGPTMFWKSAAGQADVCQVPKERSLCRGSWLTYAQFTL